jgi:replicative DNA helicase Mcm
MDNAEDKFNIKEFFELHKKSIIKSMRKSDIENKVVHVLFEDIAQFSTELAERLIGYPEETIVLLEIALEDIEWAPKNARVRLDSLSKSQELNIRNIRAKHLGKLISINGIIRRASEIRPLMTNARYECPSCGTIMSILQIDKEIKEPSRCACGRKGGFKEISKDMIDSQIAIIEEDSNDLENGANQPKRINVWLREDLTDPTMSKRISPGSKVKVIGRLIEVKMAQQSKTLTKFDIAIDANNIIPLQEDLEEFEITEEDEIKIKEISQREDLFDYLGNSIAPSVYGNNEIKRALTLQLFGGVSSKRTDGSFCREQIHGLLVGDPGVAKSVILRYIKDVSHKARYVSGKSTTGCGITASVVKDEMTGGYALEAGAMVLANNGSICVDEFEKMSEDDRSSMHEAMEQQTVSVAKATIQATLNAKTSVLAAANPKYGRFDVSKPFASQINLVPSLLSRFDFIFVMRDIPEELRDSLISDKIFEEHSDDKKSDILDKEMFKKYVAYAKSYQPKMGDNAKKVLKDYYIKLRGRTKYVEGKAIIPIGARQLEGLIRFSEASAKIKLRKTITGEDAKIAIGVMESYLKEIGYDKENDTFDVDAVVGNGVQSRNKIGVIKSAIKILAGTGKSVTIEQLKSTVETQIGGDEVDELIDKLIRNGEAFRPTRGIIQMM